jgi:hypothetical protein
MNVKNPIGMVLVLAQRERLSLTEYHTRDRRHLGLHSKRAVKNIRSLGKYEAPSAAEKAKARRPG